MDCNLHFKLFPALLAALLSLAPIAAMTQDKPAAPEVKKPESPKSPAPDTPAVKKPEPPKTPTPDTPAVKKPEPPKTPTPTIPEAAPSSKPDAVPLEGEWTKKFVLRSDDGAFSFQPSGRVQPLFKLPLNPDADEPVEGLGFALKRARFGFCALMFHQVTLSMDADLAKGTASLVDYYLDYNPFGGRGGLDGVAVLRMGHFRPWFGRQFLMSTAKMQFIEDAQAWKDEAMGLALQRDLGVGLHGMVQSGLEYGIGVWNGDDWPSKVWNGQDDARPSQFDTKSPGTVGLAAGVDRIPGNIDFMFGGRVAVHPLALAHISEPIPPGAESDVDISVKPRLSVGLSLLYNKRHNQIVNMAGADQDPDYQLYYDGQLKLGVDLALFLLGFSAQAEMFVLSTKAQSDTPAPIKTLVSSNSLDGTGLGAYLQLGMFVWPKRLEVAGRFDMVNEDLDTKGFRLFPGLGLTGHIFGNNLKAQLMYRLNVVAGYQPNTPTPSAWQDNPTSHDILLMLQASI